MFGPYGPYPPTANVVSQSPITSGQVVSIPTPLDVLEKFPVGYICRAGHVTWWDRHARMTWCDTCGWGGDEVPAVPLI